VARHPSFMLLSGHVLEQKIDTCYHDLSWRNGYLEILYMFL